MRLRVWITIEALDELQRHAILQDVSAAHARNCSVRTTRDVDEVVTRKRPTRDSRVFIVDVTLCGP
jgi:hypothetical protein